MTDSANSCKPGLSAPARPETTKEGPIEASLTSLMTRSPDRRIDP